MKVYITRCALTQGIIEKEAELSSISNEMITVIAGGYRQCYHKPFWHETKEDAIAHAELLRTRKIASLKKALLKLEQTDFSTY